MVYTIPLLPYLDHILLFYYDRLTESFHIEWWWWRRRRRRWLHVVAIISIFAFFLSFIVAENGIENNDQPNETSKEATTLHLWKRHWKELFTFNGNNSIYLNLSYTYRNHNLDFKTKKKNDDKIGNGKLDL